MVHGGERGRDTAHTRHRSIALSTQSSYDPVLIRYSFLADAAGMATLQEKIKVEAQVRELLAQNGLPQPDSVEYGFTCIRLFFNEPKTVLIVDIDEPPEDGGESSSEGYFVDVKTSRDDFAMRPIDGDNDATWN